MNFFARVGFGAAMLAGFALAPASSALASHWSQSSGVSHSSHGSAPSSLHGGLPRGFHGSLPSSQFRGAPPGFHGTSRSFRGPGAPQMNHGFNRQFGGPSHSFGGGPSRNFSGGNARNFHGGPSGNFRGSFHGHDFAHFSDRERDMWQHGQWRHSWHNGHLGWWWFADNFWFFYPEPIYPYPTYVGPNYYYNSDEYDNGGYGSDYYWYWCDNPRGYYPYVQQCNDEWQPVAPTPPGPGYDNQGGYDDQNGYDGGGDDGPN